MNNLLQQHPHIPKEWDIDLKNPIGKGFLSDGVYKARKLNSIINGKTIPNNGECAVKIIGKNHNDKMVLGEVEMIDRLIKLGSCDEIIQFYGFGFDSDGKCYIYMEYLKEFQTITQTIKKRTDKRLTLDEIAHIHFRLLTALEFLHKNNLIHRDIKCDNILYNEITYKIKLIDFGASKYTQTNALTYAGTPTHMAPESKLQTPQTTSKSDLWSLGCTLIEMAGGDLSKVNEYGIPEIPENLGRLIKMIRIYLVVDPFLREGSSGTNFDQIVKKYLIDMRNAQQINDLNDSVILPETDHVFLLNKEPYQINQVLKFPPIVSTLTLNYIINPSYIPSSIKKLMVLNFNELIEPDTFPSNLSVLYLLSFNQPIKSNSIPSSIESLYLPSLNKNLDEHSLPDSLVALFLGESFDLNENGDYLPGSLKILYCEFNFKQPLKKNNNIPNGICRLELTNYNQPITIGSIPKNVNHLRIGSNYTHFESLKNLPSYITFLHFGVENLNEETNNSIQQYTPESVIEIRVNNEIIRYPSYKHIKFTKSKNN